MRYAQLIIAQNGVLFGVPTINSLIMMMWNQVSESIGWLLGNLTTRFQPHPCIRVEWVNMLDLNLNNKSQVILVEWK
jgi:hypothetical protein